MNITFYGLKCLVIELRIYNKNRLWGLINYCKKNMSVFYNLEIIELNIGYKPINPTNLIILKK